MASNCTRPGTTRGDEQTLATHEPLDEGSSTSRLPRPPRMRPNAAAARKAAGFRHGSRTTTALNCAARRIEEPALDRGRHARIDVAVYLDRWRRKVERVGTLNFPDVARRDKLSGTPVIEVTIGANGRLEQALIRRSSGHSEIDAAAHADFEARRPIRSVSARLERQTRSDPHRLRMAILGRRKRGVQGAVLGTMSESGYLTNQLLIAMPAMLDPNFAQTVALICDHGPRGALGLILNKPLQMRMGEIFEQLEIECAYGPLRAAAGAARRSGANRPRLRRASRGRLLGLDADRLRHDPRDDLARHTGRDRARRGSGRGGGRTGICRLGRRTARGRDSRQCLAQCARWIPASSSICRSNRAGRPRRGCWAWRSRASARSAVMPEASPGRARPRNS
jgi:TonB family protein